MTYQVNTNQKEAEIDIAALGMTISDHVMSLGIFINILGICKISALVTLGLSLQHCLLIAFPQRAGGN